MHDEGLNDGVLGCACECFLGKLNINVEGQRTLYATSCFKSRGRLRILASMPLLHLGVLSVTDFHLECVVIDDRYMPRVALMVPQSCCYLYRVSSPLGGTYGIPYTEKITPKILRIGVHAKDQRILLPRRWSF